MPMCKTCTNLVASTVEAEIASLEVQIECFQNLLDEEAVTRHIHADMPLFFDVIEADHLHTQACEAQRELDALQQEAFQIAGLEQACAAAENSLADDESSFEYEASTCAEATQRLISASHGIQEEVVECGIDRQVLSELFHVVVMRPSLELLVNGWPLELIRPGPTIESNVTGWNEAATFVALIRGGLKLEPCLVAFGPHASSKLLAQSGVKTKTERKATTFETEADSAVASLVGVIIDTLRHRPFISNRRISSIADFEHEPIPISTSRWPLLRGAISSALVELLSPT